MNVPGPNKQATPDAPAYSSLKPESVWAMFAELAAVPTSWDERKQRTCRGHAIQVFPMSSIPSPMSYDLWYILKKRTIACALEPHSCVGMSKRGGYANVRPGIARTNACVRACKHARTRRPKVSAPRASCLPHRACSTIGCAASTYMHIHACIDMSIDTRKDTFIVMCMILYVDLCLGIPTDACICV